jgi:hypothetical protein
MLDLDRWLGRVVFHQITSRFQVSIFFLISENDLEASFENYS